MNLYCRIRNFLLEPDLGENAFVESSFSRATSIELMVVLLEALPMETELIDAVLIDILENRGCTASDPTAFLKAINGVSA